MEIDKKSSDMLGVTIEKNTTDEVVIEKVWCEECGSKGVIHKSGCKMIPNTTTENVDEESNPGQLLIENLDEVIEKVREENKQKEFNPGTVLEGEAGVVFIEGKPMIIIGNEYFPEEEAIIVLKTRKVVREYLKLQSLINKKK